MAWVLLWRAIERWWVVPDATPMDTIAAQLSAWTKTEAGRDWFTWEGEQFAKCPSAFWFDHWRYRNSWLAYPEPTEPQRRANWNASLQRMIAIHGEPRMKAISNAMVPILEGHAGLEDAYWHAPAPWEWVMATYQASGAVH